MVEQEGYGVRERTLRSTLLARCQRSRAHTFFTQ
jgi:hypothetical protein